jgi:hypothetical protein
MQSIALGLTPRNRIFSADTFSAVTGWLLRFSLFRVLPLDTCSVGRFLCMISIFSDEFIGYRSNVVNFFHIFLVPPWLLMSYSLFKKSLYSFDMAVFIHILCYVLSTITVNNSLADFCHPKFGLSNTTLIPRC